MARRAKTEEARREAPSAKIYIAVSGVYNANEEKAAAYHVVKAEK